MDPIHRPILKKVLLLMVCAFGLYASSCKKENTVLPPAPNIDSNFLKFTSSVPFDGFLNYVAAKPASVTNYLENDGIRTVFASDYRSFPGGYDASVYFTGRFDPPKIQLPLTIDIKRNVTNSIAAGISLTFPNTDPKSGNWYPASGSMTIVELGNQRAKGYFSTTLINDSLAGQTIEITQGTFNFSY